MTAPAHCNPDPMFGLRVQSDRWIETPLLTKTDYIGFVTVNWERLMTPLRDDDLIVHANSAPAEHVTN